MSESIDERVVSMKLNNGTFEDNAKRSLSTLGALAKALKLDGSAKGLEGVSAAAKNVNLDKVAQSVDGLAGKFKTLSVIGISALATIASQATAAGLSVIKSLTIGPIAEGFSDYNTKLTSVQTIMNATGASIKVVDSYFKQLDTYADKTIYNLTDMTSSFAKFTNAGVAMNKSVPAIKGIANMVALAGQDASAAQIAMYNLSQSIAGGFLTTTDYKSLNLANVATSEWKNQMIQAAIQAGKLKKVGKDSYHIVGEGAKQASTSSQLFNEELKTGWASSKVLLKVLGDYGNEQTAIGKKALAAAQDVKSLPMMMDTLKASVGTGWTDTFEIIFGNVNEAKTLFTGMTNSIQGVLDKMSNGRNAVLKEWKAVGGRTDLIKAMANIWTALGNVIKPIKDAFNQIFPPMTGKRLAEITKGFRDFTEKLKMGGENMDRLKRTFAGVFAIFKVGYTIISTVVSTLFNLFGIAQGGGGSFLALTAAVGDFLVKIQTWLTTNNKIKDFFSTINTARMAILVPLIAIVGKIAEAFGSLINGDFPGFVNHLKEAFGGLGALADGVWKSMTSGVRSLLANIRDATGIAAEFLKSLGIKALEPIQSLLSKLSENFGKLRTVIQNLGLDAFKKGSEGAAKGADALGAAGDRIRQGWAAFKSAIEAVKEFLGPIGDSIGNLFTTITDKIAEFVKNLNLQDAIAVVNTAFFIMMYKAIRDFMKDMKGIGESFKGIADSISGTFDSIKGTLTSFSETLEKQVKINAILKIAIALGILAVSLKILSTIDTGKLAVALGAVGIMLVGLTKSMGAMMDMMKTVEGQAPTSAAKMFAAGGAMVLLAGAVLLLSAAVKNIASLSWEEMARGLTGTAVLIGALALFTKFSDMESMSMKGAASLAILAGAIYLLTFSISKLGNMDQGKLIQGGIAVQAVLITLAGISQLMGDTKSMKGAAGIVLMAGALSMLTPVIIALGLVPYENLAKGLGTLGIALGGMALAAQLLGDTKSMKGAAGIALMAGALALLTPALISLGFVPYENLAKGLGTIGIALGMFVIATRLMGTPETLLGAAGILIIAVALQAITPVILALGQADLKTLALGLGAMAVALAIFLAAGAVAMSVAPGLIVLGVAIGLVGAAMALAGVGFLAFATGFATLVAIGTAGFAVLTVGFSSLLSLIPLFAQQVGLGIIAIAVVISNSGPRIIDAITTVLISFLRAIQRAAPQFFSTMTTLIMGLVATIARLTPFIASQGAQMILRLLTVIQNYVPQFARKATDIMLAFINAIATNVPRLVDGGLKAVIALVNGVANAIRSNSAALNAAGRNLASAIVEGMVNGITGGLGAVISAAKNLAKSALDSAKAALGIHSPSREFTKLGDYSVQGFANGLRGNKAAVNAAMDTMRKLVRDTQTAIAKDVADATANLARLNKARKKDRAAISRAKAALAQAKAEQAKVNAANALLKTYGDEQAKLGQLATSYDSVTTKLSDARKALQDATKTRDDYAKSVQDQYNKLPDFNADTNLTDFVANLEKSVVNTQLYTAQLEELRKQGLSDAMYKQFLAKGTDGMAFAKQLLDGGKGAINQVNSLTTALDKAAGGLGSSASKALYQAGVDSAAGLVKGLENQQKAIQAQMDKIATSMVNAIKKKLGIKSPSREFMKVGDWSMQGLANGLKSSSSITEAAATQVGHGTIEAMRKSLSGLSAAVASNIDVDPTIRPVLDLSQVQRDSVKMGAMLGAHGVAVSANLKSARAASAGQAANQGAQQEMAYAGNGDSLTFIQNNTSPAPLSEATIYRQTKNQISTAKGALKN